MDRIFTFPNPVDEISARLVATGVVTMTVLLLVTGQWWILVPLVYGFAARVAAGPRFSPLGLLATRVVRPRLAASPRPVAGPPKRLGVSRVPAPEPEQPGSEPQSTHDDQERERTGRSGEPEQPGSELQEGKTLRSVSGGSEDRSCVCPFWTGTMRHRTTLGGRDFSPGGHVSGRSPGFVP